MPSKTAFTSGDIEEALDISNRRQIYLVDRGLIEADMRKERPRLFSPYMALKIGLLEYFSEQHGFTLDRAERLAEVVALVAASRNEEAARRLPPNVTFQLVVENGLIGGVSFGTPEDDLEPMLVFTLDDRPAPVEGARLNRRERLLVTQFKVTIELLVDEFLKKLGAEKEDVRIPNSARAKLTFSQPKEGQPSILDFSGVVQGWTPFVGQVGG